MHVIQNGVSLLVYIGLYIYFISLVYAIRDIRSCSIDLQIDHCNKTYFYIIQCDLWKSLTFLLLYRRHIIRERSQVHFKQHACVYIVQHTYMIYAHIWLCWRRKEEEPWESWTVFSRYLFSFFFLLYSILFTLIFCL